MKNLFFLIILVVAIGMVSCTEATKSQQQTVVNQYHNNTCFFKYTYVYQGSTYNKADTLEVYYAAKDKYEAQRLSDTYVKENMVEVELLSSKSEEIMFTSYQQYPYWQ